MRQPNQTLPVGKPSARNNRSADRKPITNVVGGMSPFTNQNGLPIKLQVQTNHKNQIKSAERQQDFNKVKLVAEVAKTQLNPVQPPAILSSEKK